MESSPDNNKGSKASRVAAKERLSKLLFLITSIAGVANPENSLRESLSITGIINFPLVSPDTL